MNTINYPAVTYGHSARVEEVGDLLGTLVYQARCVCGWEGARSEVPDPDSSGLAAYLVAHNEVRWHIAIARVQDAKTCLAMDMTDASRAELQRACTDLIRIRDNPTP